MSDQDTNPACATGKIRLYVDAPLETGGGVALGPEQTHYIVNVMRLEVGAPVLLFNGRDGEWQGEITKANKRGCLVALRTRTREQDAVCDLHLLFAPVKRARLDYLVQKATELGVSAIRPVMTRHTNVARVKEERLRANVIEAAEQCGRLSVPEILPTLDLAKALAEAGTRKVLFCDEGGHVPPIAEALDAERNNEESGVWAVLIGPEGGFAAEERAMLRAQGRVVAVSLGPRIMRSDTAAIAALSLWQAYLGDW